MGIKSTRREREQTRKVSGSPNSVVSVAIFDGKLPLSGPVPNSLKVQLVVRDPATNCTHGDVISVPTMRLPSTLIDGVLDFADGDEEDYGRTTLYRSHRMNNVSQDGHNPVIFAVEGVLSRKLGVADLLERGKLTFSAAPFAQAVGSSIYHESVRHSEQIRMAGILVEITQGAELFPAQTASYSHVLWVSVREFLEAVRTKNPAIVGLDPFKFCIYGLCIATTYDLLAHRLGLSAFCDLPLTLQAEM